MIQDFIRSASLSDGGGPLVGGGRRLQRVSDGSAQSVMAWQLAVVTPRDPVGTRVAFGGQEVQIVGVVSDVRNRALRDDAQPTAYVAVAQRPEFLRSLEVRTAIDPATVAGEVRRALDGARAGGALAPIAVTTMRAQLDRSLVQERLLAVLSTGFGLAALFLLGVGLHGVVARRAGHRTREIGVRVALGASAGVVRWMVVRQALWLVLVGLAVGLPCAAADRSLRSLLFEVTPLDPATMAASSAALLSVAAAPPARRASRVDPLVALRSG